jgi:hypothetical protein
MEYAVGGGSRYVPDLDPNKIGKIWIDQLKVEDYVRFYGTALHVVRTMLIHEMGHFMGELQGRATRPKDNAPPTAHVDWCYMHEARATLFAYMVAKELKAKGLPAYVIAPTPTMDVFAALAEAERTGRNLLMLAKSYYAADTTYNLYCRGHITWTGHSVQQIHTVRIVGKRRSPAAARR